MAKKKRVLIFGVPFSGHLNVLKELIGNNQEACDFKLVITGWKNIPADLQGLKNEVKVIEKSELKDTDPTLWTLPRVAEQLEECLTSAQEYNPDLIIYDFFSLEGNLVGKLLDIPYWCSIPALPGPFETQDYLREKLSLTSNQEAIKIISEKYGVEIDQEKIEMISDGLHLPGQVNIVWSYKDVTPSDYQKNRSKDPYVFVGSSKHHYPAQEKTRKSKPRIYFSFGTVVMNNLWNQQEETREKLFKFFTSLADMWKDRPWDIVFVSQGKKTSKQFPSNWQIFDTVNQMEELSLADVFITHAGSNGFHEAIVQKVPMVAIPFFGDQPLVAKRIQTLGIGINLGKNSNIDTNKSKDFLNKDLAIELDKAVSTILENKKYRQSFDELRLKQTDLKSLLDGKIHFSEGDLLFGTNVARKKYVDETDSQEEFKILEFKAFSELVSKENALPRIVDIYHDVVLSNDYFEKDINSNLKPYTEILRKYKEHLGDAKDFCTMCIKGLDFFSELYRIHFILSDYDPTSNYITTEEIKHVIYNRKRFEESVIFYEKVATAWIPLSYEEVEARFLK